MFLLVVVVCCSCFIGSTSILQICVRRGLLLFVCVLFALFVCPFVVFACCLLLIVLVAVVFLICFSEFVCCLLFVDVGCCRLLFIVCMFLF